MIDSKEDLKKYLEADELSRFGKKVGLLDKIKLGDLWRFNFYLRKLEYYTNTGKNPLFRIIYKIKLRKVQARLGYEIPLNSFGEGLCVVHRGSVIVSQYSKFGKYCRINANVNIGANAGTTDAPQGGDYIYFGPGVKCFGAVSLASRIAVGANAVVTKSFEEPGITIAGIPARKISSKGSYAMIKER